MSDGPNVGFATVSLIPSMRGAEGLIAGEASKAGALAGSGFAAKFKSFITDPKVLGFGALVAGGGVLLKLGDSFEKAFNQIRVSTGATGSSLSGLEGDFKSLLAVRPDSMTDVATAISKLHQQLGLTGAPLQALGKQILQLSSITKTDLGSNLQAVTTLFNSWGISAADQGPKLDELFRASQATGASVSDLASQMASAGPLFHTAGLSFEQSAGILGLLSKAGISATTVMLPLSSAISKAAKQGKSAADVLRSTFDAIRTAPNDTKAAGDAVTIFGTRAGPKLAGLIRQGKLSYDDFAKAIATGTDTIGKAAADTATFSSKWKTFLNSLKVTFQPLASGLVTALTSAMTIAAPILSRVTSTISSIISGLVAAFRPVATAVQTAVGAFRLLGQPGGVQAFAKTMDTLLGGSGRYVAFFQSLGGEVLKAKGVFESVTARAGEIFGGISSVIVDAAKSIGDFLIGTLLPDVRTAISTIEGILDPWAERARRAFDKIRSAVEDHLTPALQNKLLPILKQVGAVTLISGGTIAGLSSLVSLGGSLGGVIQALAILPNPIVLIAAAVAALVAGLVVAYNHSARFRQIVNQLATDLRGKLNEAIAVVRAHWPQWKADLEQIWDVLQNKVFPVLERVGDFLKNHLEATLVAIGGAILLAISPWALLVAGLVYAYTRFKAVREIVAAVAEFFETKVAPAVAKMASAIREQFDHLVSFISSRWGAISEAARHVFDVVRDIVTVVLNVLRALWRAWGDDILRIAKTLFTFVAATIRNALEVIRGIIDLVLGLINGDWGRAWHGLVEIFGGLFNEIGAILSGALKLVGEILGGLLSTVGVVFQGIWQEISSVVSAVVGFIIDHWRGILEIITGPFGVATVFIVDHFNQIVDFIGSLPGRVGRFFAVLWDGLISGVSAAARWVGDRISDIVGFVSGLPGQIAKFASGMWDGLKDGLDAAVTWILGRIDTLVNGIISGIDLVIQGINDINPGPNIPKIPKLGSSSPKPTKAQQVPSNLKFAEGGIVNPRPGGLSATIAEAGHRELILPLTPAALAPFAAALAAQKPAHYASPKATSPGPITLDLGPFHLTVEAQPGADGSKFGRDAVTAMVKEMRVNPAFKAAVREAVAAA